MVEEEEEVDFDCSFDRTMNYDEASDDDDDDDVYGENDDNILGDLESDMVEEEEKEIKKTRTEEEENVSSEVSIGNSCVNTNVAVVDGAMNHTIEQFLAPPLISVVEQVEIMKQTEGNQKQQKAR